MSDNASATRRVDFLVIGSGPAGQKAAIQAAKAGRQVVMLEREREVGGACVHTGTIPSKSLREQALRRRFAGAPSAMDVPLDELLAGVGDTIAAHDRYMAAQLERNGVQLIRGRARFLDRGHVEVRQISGARLVFGASRIVIATGSRPRAMADVPVDHEHVLDSDSILSLAYLPRTLLVLGGGVIASEYASMFSALGCRVTQADRNDRPLPFVDPELTAYYAETLRMQGGQFLAGHTARSVEWDSVSQVRTVFENGATLATDKVLVAFGRTANVDELGLDAAGVSLTRAGHIDVDHELQTAVPGIYAAGDVIGPPALASTAMEQGRRAACHALGLYSLGELRERIPVGIYTIPEISSVGLDEGAARTHFGGALVGRARFGEIARGQIAGTPHGLLKLVADPDGRRVVGIQIVGPGATELVHIGQMGLAADFDVDTYVDTVFNFPTMAEAYRVAALDVVRQRRAGCGNEAAAAAAADVL